MSWEKTTIGDHCTVTSSKRFHLSDRTNCGVPFYCSKEIIQKVKSEEIDNCDYISEEFYEAVAQKYGVPQEIDLLVTTRGTIGVPYLYKKSDRFYFADGNLTWMKDFQSTLLPQYLYYWFLSHEGQSKIDSIAKGTAQKAVPIAGIKTLELLLPPIEIQCRIADILSAYDVLIENNRKQIKLLEEAAQRLYKEWFVDLRFPGYEHAKITDGVPEGWHKALLGDIIDVKYGKDHKGIPDGTIPVYGSGGLMRKCDRALCDGESVLIPRKGSLNNIIYLDERFWTVDTMFYTELKKPNIGLFLYFSLKTLDMYSMNIGAAVPSMTTAILNTMEVVLPDDSLLGRFQRLTKNNFNAIKTLSVQSELASQARDRLLPKLMSGEVEV